MGGWQQQPQEHSRILGMSLVALASAARFAGRSADPLAVLEPLAEAAADILGDRAAEFAARIAGAGEARRHAAFVLRDPADGALLPVAGAGLPAEALWQPLAAAGVADRLMDTGTPLLLAETGTDAAFRPPFAARAAGSAMFTPLSWSGTTLGFLYCASSAPATYGEADLSILGGFADLAALVWIARDGQSIVPARRRSRQAMEPL